MDARYSVRTQRLGEREQRTQDGASTPSLRLYFNFNFRNLLDFHESSSKFMQALMARGTPCTPDADIVD